MSVEPLNRTLEQELNALLRGASLECLACGEFVMQLPQGGIFCPECGSPRDVYEGAHEGRIELCARAGVSSARASSGVAGSLYERIEVITSKTSAIATMRPGNGISSPAIPRG